MKFPVIVMFLNADLQNSIFIRNSSSAVIIDTKTKAKQKNRMTSIFLFSKITQYNLSYSLP